MSAFAGYPLISAFLWFDDNAEDAVELYTSVFPNSRRLGEVRNWDDRLGLAGSIFTISFELDGQKFTALNGGPMYRFTEAISFVVRCETQTEIDFYWERLCEGSNDGQCGWLKDRFGLSWQIVPSHLPELIKSRKAMQAMLGMKKLDIAELERAAAER
jgi:predicted 3-demethylubiquinone-9 3-methyltransferase (glyoxalase superfamily)